MNNIYFHCLRYIYIQDYATCVCLNATQLVAKYVSFPSLVGMGWGPNQSKKMKHDTSTTNYII